MSPPQSFYSLTWGSSSELTPGDPKDPFRFFHDGEPLPVRAAFNPLLSLQVVDQEGNRRLDSHDHFYYLTADHRRFQIPAESGLRVLNHYLDPQVLARNRLGVLIRASSRPFDRPVQGGMSIEGISEIPLHLREEILDRPFPYWEADGHLDLDILEGLRNYRSQENQRYTGWEGLGIYLDGRYAGTQLGITGLVAGGFMAGEHLTNSPFMWQTYTTNFLSSIAGSLEHHTEWNESLRLSESLSSTSGISPSQRRLANIEAADARARMARDHLYWTFMTPIVIAACLADANFRHFLRSPGILPRYFSAQMGTAFHSLGGNPLGVLRNPLGLGLAAVAGFGIYEISSTWFDLYGGLRRGTAENQIFSGVSTFLSEMALLSRVSRELQAMTGSGALTWRNLRTLASLRPQWGIFAEIPEGSLLARYGSNSPRLQALFQRSFLPTVELSSQMGPMAILNRIGLPRVGLEARLSSPLALETGTMARTVSAESLLSRAIVRSPAAVLAEGEGMIATEGMLSVRRVRVAGLPLLGVAAGLGLAIGAGYLTGYFNGRYGPRDLLREWIGH